MMNIDAIAALHRRSTILPLSIVILAGFACALGMQNRGAPTDAPAASVYRANLQHTGLYDAPGVPQLHGLVWKSMVEGRQCPVTVGEGVLCSGRSVYPGLCAFDIQTSKKLWDFPAGIFNGSPAIADGLVYASYGNGTEKGGGLRALDLKTGKSLWNFATPSIQGERAAPIVRAGVVYLVSRDGNLYALDARTGQEKWRFPYVDAIATTPTSPAIAGGTLYFGGGGRLRSQKDGFFNGLFAVDLETGREKWKTEVSLDPVRSSKSTVNILDTPAVADGTVYFGTGSNMFCAVDAGSGAMKWYYQAGGYVTAPAVGPEMVYFGSNDKCMHALDRNTGREIWTMKTDGMGVSIPSLARGILYFGGGATPITGLGNCICAVDAGTGAMIWKFETDQPNPGRPQMERWQISPPVVVDDSVYFTCWTKAYRLH